MRVRDELKESAIREKAMEMIVAEGFDGLSMQKLAKAANVSPATIYIYYKNREDLLNSLYNTVNDTFARVALEKFSPDLMLEEGLWMHEIHPGVSCLLPVFRAIQKLTADPSQGYQVVGIQREHDGLCPECDPARGNEKNGTRDFLVTGLRYILFIAQISPAGEKHDD